MTDSTTIPKMLHYCWFGQSPLPENIQQCIDSWHQYCPEYKIIQWDETNSPINIPFIKDALHHKKYAFAADYTRFYALHTFGGIYLDTDMLLLRPLDSLLNHQAFAGREDETNVNFAIIGCKKGNSFSKECLSIYDNLTFDLMSPPIITRLITPILKKYGLSETDENQTLSNNLEIYKSDYFYPIHYTQIQELVNLDTIDQYTTQNTIAVHLWNKSWKDEFHYLANNEYKKGFKIVRQRILRNPLLPIKYYKKLIKYVLIYLNIYPSK